MSELNVETLAASLRTHTGDLALYAGFLVNTLAEALPPDVVQVRRQKKLFQRSAGPVLGVSIQLGDWRFALGRSAVGAQVQAEVVHESRGVVLSTTRLGIDAWCRELAAALTRYAEHHAAAAETLRRITLPGLP